MNKYLSNIYLTYLAMLNSYLSYYFDFFFLIERVFILILLKFIKRKWFIDSNYKLNYKLKRKNYIYIYIYI